MNPQMPAPAPQAQPVAPTAPQPMAQAPAQGQLQPAQGSQQSAQIEQAIEEHLNSLPDPQKALIVKYMTPEMAVILGIILGPEAFDYFKKFADPRKELTVTERKNTAPQQLHKQAGASEQQSANVNLQPKATTPPAKSIMAV